MKMHKYLRIVILFFLIGINFTNFAQKSDSVIKRYADSIYLAPPHSEKRQRYIDSVSSLISKDALKSQNVSFLKTKAMLLFKQKKYELGMLSLDSAVMIDKTTDALVYRAFIKCIFQKNYGESLKDFEKATQLNGNAYVMDHPYEFYMGLCYLQLNQFDKAKELFFNCVEKDRKERGEQWVHPSHWFYLGIALYEQGNYIQAINCFDNCLKLYPGFSDSEFYKAVCLVKLNELSTALTILLEAEVHYNQGRSIAESNAIYEIYPYQIYKYQLAEMLKKIRSIQIK